MLMTDICLTYPRFLYSGGQLVQGKDVKKETDWPRHVGLPYMDPVLLQH